MDSLISLKNVEIKAMHVVPGLVLQKPSKSSKVKDHLNALDRCLKLWEEGEMLELLDERRTI